MTKSFFIFILISLMSVSMCWAGTLTSYQESQESDANNLKFCQMFITAKSEFRTSSRTHWLLFEVEGTYPVASDLTITGTVSNGSNKKLVSVILPKGTVDANLEVYNPYYDEGYTGMSNVEVTPTEDHTYYYGFIIWR